eukprot:TRINITY_DN102100_c0_g1_i1.p1 TRINITY_DN102100_c0_g1~~TRINITY_DN102100_c0_g1_i1.p1  ORF type:complete len:673 (-),score=110.40 TRINITY_DN102100_c0_g1_i1:283-2301(-)
MTDSPDLVIRGGTIVDGSGNPPFIGDVAISGDRIISIGPQISARGKREYDAKGLIVTPGWVDGHTHFDAQVTWDPYLTPSTWNGVTTAIFGNCGIGFAPCQKDRREFLTHLIEAVEDIPGRVIAEGMNWDFETFEEYLDSLEKRAYACDTAVMIGHCAVRAWVMGKRANAADRQLEHRIMVTPDECAAMAALVQDAVAAGALGFSTSRGLFHRDPEGNLIPGTLATPDEVLAFARGIAAGGGGIFQWTTEFASYDDLPYAQLNLQKIKEYQDGELEWMTQIARDHGGKVALTFNLGWSNNRGAEQQLRQQLGFLDAIHQAGGFARGQIFGRTQGFLFSFRSRLHPFVSSKTFRRMDRRCRKLGEDLLEKLQDASVRELIVSETEHAFSEQSLQANPGLRELAGLVTTWDIIYKWRPDYEPKHEDCIKHVARREGKNPLHLSYEHLAAGGILWKPLNTYSTRDHSPFYEAYNHPHVVVGGDDAGAHHTVFMDATNPSHMLTHWVRDRARGPKLDIARAVRLQTREVAELFGLKDRGLLAPGMKADLNVIDLDKLEILEPYFTEDLPLGAGRWLQRVDGYRLTVVSGQETFRDGVATGNLPGRLVRNPRRDANAWQGVAARVSGPFEGVVIDTDAEESRQRALQGAGSGGGSMAARVMRETVEKRSADEPTSRL